MEHPWITKWRDNRYAWLLASLVLIGMLYPLAGLGHLSRIVWEVTFWAVMLQVVVTACESRALRRTGLALTSIAVMASATITIMKEATPPELRLGALLLSVGLMGIGTLLVALDVFRGERRVTLDQVYGAACAYILIGLTFAVVFLGLDVVAELGGMAEPFEFRVNPPGESAAERLAGYLYVSFVTLTTLGYGDVAPAVWASRFFCGAEALLGQLYLAILVARLLGLHITEHHSRLER